MKMIFTRSVNEYKKPAGSSRLAGISMKKRYFRQELKELRIIVTGLDWTGRSHMNRL
jgi:hypothetical protein